MTTESKSTKEIWKDIKDYEGLYQVSNLGRVKGLNRVTNIGRRRPESIFTPGKCSHGYFRAGISKNAKRRTFAVHRLVAQAFIPNPENKPEVNHINGIKTDNRVENLEWVDRFENVRHAWDTGLQRKHLGEKHGMSKVTKSDVLFIRANHERFSRKELCDRFGIGTSQVCAIIRRQSWKHI